MAKKADIVKLYKILARPFPLETCDFEEIYGVCRSTAQDYRKQAQDAFARKTGQKIDPRYVTRNQMLIANDWSWDEIRNEALAIIAATKGERYAMA